DPERQRGGESHPSPPGKRRRSLEEDREVRERPAQRRDRLADQQDQRAEEGVPRGGPRIPRPVGRPRREMRNPGPGQEHRQELHRGDPEAAESPSDSAQDGGGLRGAEPPEELAHSEPSGREVESLRDRQRPGDRKEEEQPRERVEELVLRIPGEAL